MRKIFVALFLIICVSFVLSGCLKKIEKMPCCLKYNATVQNICVLEDGTVFKNGGVGTADHPTTVTCDPDILKMNLTCNISKGQDEYELYPICTEREFSPCEMNNCTTMLCGSFKFKPELVISPSASTYNRDKLEEEAKKSGIATGLLNGMCVFIPYDGSLGEIMQKSRGSYVNTFRIGINGGTAGYSTYEKLRLLFPISDKMCNINPFGSVDRYMNYLVPPYAVDTTKLLTVYDPIKDFEKEKYLKSPYKKPFQTTSYLGADGTYKFFYGNVKTYASDYYKNVLEEYYPDVFVKDNFMSLYKDKSYSDIFIDYSFYLQALRYMYHGYTVAGSKTGKAPYECESALDCYSTNCDVSKYKREVCRKSDGTLAPCECRMAYDPTFQSFVVRCKPVGLKNLRNAGSNTASGYLSPSYDMIQKFDNYYQYVYDDIAEKKPMKVSLCVNYYNKTYAETIYPALVSLSLTKGQSAGVFPDKSKFTYSVCSNYLVDEKGYQFKMDDKTPDQFDEQYQKHFNFPELGNLGRQYYRYVPVEVGIPPTIHYEPKCWPNSDPFVGDNPLYKKIFLRWAQYQATKDEFDNWIPSGYDPTILFPGMSEMPTDGIIIDKLKALKMNTSILGFSILTPESFKRTALVEACNLKEDVDYHTFQTKELVPHLNHTLGNTLAVQPFLIDSEATNPCSRVNTLIGEFAAFDGEEILFGTSSEYVTLITDLGSCGKGVASVSNVNVDGPTVKNLGICEPCTYATMASHTVAISDNPNYIHGKTEEYLMQNIIPVIDLSEYDLGLTDKITSGNYLSHSNYYFKNPAMKTIQDDPGPVIIIAGTVSPLYFLNSITTLAVAVIDGIITVEEYNAYIAILNNEAQLARQKLLYRINQIRLDCKKCIIALKVMPSFSPYDFKSDRFPSRLHNSEILLDQLFGLSSNYESCIEAAKHGNECPGQSLINNISLIAYDYYPDEVALDYFADAGYYGEVDENIFVGQMENFSHSMLKKFNTPTFVHNFGIIGAVGDSSDPATSSMTQTSPSNFANSQAGKVYSQLIQKIILKQTNLTNNGIISIMFSANISNPLSTTVSMYDPKLVPVQNGTSIISFGRPDTLVLRTDVPLDDQSARCSICTPLEVAMKKCGITKCANGVECLLRDDVPKASQFCPDSLLPPDCKLCTDSIFSGKNIFCNMTYTNGSVVKFGPVSFETAGHKDNISIYSDVIASLGNGYRCCAKDDGDKVYSFYKKESTTSMLSPILFSKLGLEDKRCDFMTADPGQFCGMSIALKNYLIECGVK